jgi:SAM-dependent methyltransferase
VETHPDRLAAVGKLFGMAPAPVTGCRVLEIGCGDATNLICMAYALAASRFTGVDAAPEPLAIGQHVVDRLRLRNVTLLAQDLRWIGPAFGEFDYIMAHGVYSWVSMDIRDRLMAVCAERLAPNGIALISYNTPPGRAVRQLLRDALRFHTQAVVGPDAKLSEARHFLQFFLQSRTMAEEWAPIVEREVQLMLERGDGGLFHDDLAPVNDPVYFHEFAAHAARHGLQYLGDAQPHEMIDQNGVLEWAGDDVIAREQYLDFLKARRFRETLLCRGTVRLDRAPLAEVMDGFCFSSAGRGVRVRAADEIVQRVALALDQVYPLPVRFEELVPYAGDRAALREILFSLVRGGFASLHIHDFPCEDSVTPRPTASALARLQAEDTDSVSNLLQQTVELDDAARKLIVFLDGKRTLGDAAAEAGLAGEEARNSAEWMARVGLLEA